MYLIVGLGNPGARYCYTRHNIGFRVADRISQAYGIPMGREKFKAVYGRGLIHDRDVILAKPQSYMNMSGPPTRHLAGYFKIDASNLLVIHDDIDFPFGKIKSKMKGGHGGHNGLRSLVQVFGSGDFARIRIGIGRPETKEEVTDYVLGRFDQEQENLLDEVILRAQDAVEAFISGKAG
ncbi:MAG: aminoacyl-tRNA hydrolase [Desulfobacteria bacterium]